MAIAEFGAWRVCSLALQRLKQLLVASFGVASAFGSLWQCDGSVWIDIGVEGSVWQADGKGEWSVIEGCGIGRF